jgi:hypothetical protein
MAKLRSKTSRSPWASSKPSTVNSPSSPKNPRSSGQKRTLLLALLGEKTAANPRGIKFLDAPIARYGKYGLIHLDPEVQSITPETALVDPWGEQYYLMLESTGDNRIPSPERLPGERGQGATA